MTLRALIVIVLWAVAGGTAGWAFGQAIPGWTSVLVTILWSTLLAGLIIERESRS